MNVPATFPPVLITPPAIIMWERTGAIVTMALLRLWLRVALKNCPPFLILLNVWEVVQVNNDSGKNLEFSGPEENIQMKPKYMAAKRKPKT